MNCPLCKSTRYRKAGFAKGRQRYLCRPCKYYYTVTQKSKVKSSEVRRLAFDMYLEGMGSVQQVEFLVLVMAQFFFWIKQCGSNFDLPVRNETLEVVELDEVHSYVGKKLQMDLDCC